MKFLCDAGADRDKEKDSQTPLITASLKGNVDVVRFLCQAGADKDKEQDSQTPLIVASLIGHLEVVRVLCDAGADRGMRSTNALTPLSVAEHMGHLDVLCCLRQGACRPTADGTGGDDGARPSQRRRVA